ncbi:hypothetical protein GUITHDRAFT_145289 [Guillardia theta CCMP2712]|uniref:beta-galactoside alpha-(2,6)-sialyltransferase n=1 Tax=Guillardia theta (strain CCMP2712) TaxID=905079 RepID=L1IMK9_GUITC|nr:hypothetical protein GUITHDRAFT_145289 [Guillardia theta CCMP2712]EKX37045.1 hypothetical protein GUITHDRAFT_145289 [Guillardia theta CCMP2712]|eukprot:XP_005824025.1 hypothetical protein GUITHDRAFT_145289 [Guillardia theta CCMP2712]
MRARAQLLLALLACSASVRAVSHCEEETSAGLQVFRPSRNEYVRTGEVDIEFRVSRQTSSRSRFYIFLNDTEVASGMRGGEGEIISRSILLLEPGRTSLTVIHSCDDGAGEGLDKEKYIGAALSSFTAVDPSTADSHLLQPDQLKSHDRIQVQLPERGWSVVVESSLERDPAKYSSSDDSIDIDCMVIQSSLTDVPSSPPVLPPGTEVEGRATFSGQPAGAVTWPPLGYDHSLKRSTSISNMHFQLAVKDIQRPGIYNFTVLIDLRDYGMVETQLQFEFEGTLSDPLEKNYPVARSSGRHVDFTFLLVVRQVKTVQHPVRLDAAGADNSFSRVKSLLRKSCAVVGNAGHIFGSKLGAEIDSHEAVMRFNEVVLAPWEAPTESFEEDVGGKTTWWVTANFPGLGGEETPEILFYYPNFKNDVEDALYWVVNRTREDIFFISPSFVQFAWKQISAKGLDKIPTSGFLGIL